MKKIPLEIVGLSYSQSQSGAYALIIGETDGKRRLPIIIGNAEAQAIALELESYKTSRPLTHDLFHSFAKTFEIEITEVIINKFSEGIFYSLLICKQNNEIAEIDSRTSDAVALALRFKCPIYTFEEILDVAGIILEDEQENLGTEEDIDDDILNIFDTDSKEKETGTGFSSYTEDELNEMLKHSITNEEFEKASVIRDELKRRSNK
jgi:uncharacterized protein